MEDHERQAVKWIYEGSSERASNALAFEHLIGDQANRSAMYPMDGREFYRCLKLIEEVPETRAALHRLAGKSRYWATLEHHWETLTEMLREETDGTMVRPWPKKTNKTIQELMGRVSSGQNLPEIRQTPHTTKIEEEG